jgi:hypothetical protein
VTAEAEELLDALEDVVGVAIGDELNSHGMSAYADALRLLARHGRAEIVSEDGNCVLARWVCPEEPA